jgi:chemotaxis response regulator CheB
MAKIAIINRSGLIRSVVMVALENSEHEFINVYIDHEKTYRINKQIFKETKGCDLIILGEKIEHRSNGWKIARKLIRRKRKVLVISESVPPKEYLKIPWLEESRLFDKEIVSKEKYLIKVIDFLTSKT